MHTATNHCTILPNFTKLSRAALHSFSTPIDSTGGWWVRLSLPDAAKAPHHAGNNTDDADADEDDGMVRQAQAATVGQAVTHD